MGGALTSVVIGRNQRRHCEERSDEACVDGPSLARSGGKIFRVCVRLRACVRPVGAARAAGQDGLRGRRSKQSSDLDRPLLRAVYLLLRIERSRPSLSVSCKVGPASSNNVPSAPISSGGRWRRSHGGACVALAARHQLPGDPRHFVGERHRRELGGLALQQRQHPAGWVLRGAPAGLPDHGGRAHDQAGCAASDRRRG